MPDIHDIKACFNANKDGAGYMLPINNKVVIRKGFMNVKSFIKDLVNVAKDNDLDMTKIPLIMHFRISTQGGVNQALTHPFPLCDNYANMRKLDNECDIGVAHNGIISLCSDYGYKYGSYDYKTKTWSKVKVPDYNDTMTFIKDYMSLIVGNDLYFGKNANKVKLTEKLIGYSKLAIMNRKGYVTLIGDFYDRNGIKYSNLHAFPSEDLRLPNWAFDDENY